MTLPDVDRRGGELRKTLGQVFDPRANALNAWRLGLALAVIVMAFAGTHWPAYASISSAPVCDPMLR